MKSILQKRSFVSNRTETLDFKDFITGLKVERSKKPVNERNFAPVGKGKLINEKFRSSLNEKYRPVKAYSIYFNPAAFFDPTFILIGAGVLAVAILEKKLAENGYTSIASAISSILRIALPGVALLSIIYLISHSSFLL
ncbi:hypothetical protein EVU96_25085 [Bacillus infantis]|uniref:hypothetical protein n=1 Tax=Bacillus infantis TaxID=324767 RepID=UPI00101D78D1|nr:hypothetical protein [Bacillus infantis]RYI25090.1 hypothetical protein EVU96_25085 [Bacillus infantis]